MKFYILDPLQVDSSLLPIQRECYEGFSQCLALSKMTGYECVNNPDIADIILAPIQCNGYGEFFNNLKRNSFFFNHKKKIFVYSIDDNQYPSLPGVYPSISKKWVDLGWARAGHYVSKTVSLFDEIDYPDRERDFLFSFVGSSRTHPIREQIVAINHNRSMILDSSSRQDDHRWYEKDADVVQSLRDLFIESLKRSKFVLCPRGISPSSIRLFEAMRMGNVPVVISDDIVLPQGPAWDELCIFIQEKQIQEIPRILEGLEEDFPLMSLKSREAWEQYFSPMMSVPVILDQCLDIQKSILYRRSSLSRYVALKELLEPKKIKSKLRRIKQILR